MLNGQVLDGDVVGVRSAVTRDGEVVDALAVDDGSGCAHERVAGGSFELGVLVRPDGVRPRANQ